MKSWAAAAAVAFSGIIAVAHSAGADPVQDFYKGKTVSVVIGFAAGGGADL